MAYGSNELNFDQISNVSVTIPMDDEHIYNIGFYSFPTIMNSIGKKINGPISTDKLYYTVLELETKRFDGEDGCIILGVEKSTDGELKYLIKWKIKHSPAYYYFVDSSVLRDLYPELIIEFYEKIIIWN